jgi:hypothetical protein
MLKGASGVPNLPAVKVAEREASRRHWLHRADLSLSAAQEMAEGPQFKDPAEIARYLKSVLDAAEGAECLSEDDREGLAYRALYIERTGYERFLDHILELMRNAIRASKKAELPPLLTAANEVIGQLRRLGLDDEGFARLKHKLLILLETAAPGGQQPKPAEAPPKLGNFQADARLYVRYVFPPLVVFIGRTRFETADWSLGGLALANVETPPGPNGSLVNVRLGLDTDKMYEEAATIVKHWEKRNQLALRFRRFGSCMVAIKREAELRGLDPKSFDQLAAEKIAADQKAAAEAAEAERQA